MRRRTGPLIALIAAGALGVSVLVTGAVVGATSPDSASSAAPAAHPGHDGAGAGEAAADAGAAGGAAIGAAATHPTHAGAAIVPAAALRPGESRTTVGIGGSYTPESRNGASDDYRCFLVDPGFARERFLTGVRFLPGNPDVVHHAILFRIEPDQVGQARAADAADPGRGWECFGGPGVGGGGLDAAPWLAAWAPGGAEQRFAAGTGVRLPRGGRAVLQVHYNLRGGEGDDSTRVQLRTRPGTADLAPLQTMLLPAPVELPCTDTEVGPLCDRTASVWDTIRRFGEGAGRTIAGLQLLCDGDPVAPKAGATQSCDRVINEELTLRSAAGHMHLLGRSIRIELNPGTDDARVILDVPTWDFDQQGARRLPAPVRVTPGDVLRVTCTHDPGLRQQLPALADMPPRYVTWGEGTTDEMCLGILAYT